MRRYFKLIVTALLLCGSSNSAVAGDENGDMLVVELVTGETHTFELSDKPVVTFSENALIVTSDVLTVELPIAYADVKNIGFKVAGTVTGTDETTLTHRRLSVKFTDENTFVVQGADEGAGVKVYAVDGKAMPADVMRDDDRISVRLNNYRRGTYIIMIGKHTYKIVKR